MKKTTATRRTEQADPTATDGRPKTADRARSADHRGLTAAEVKARQEQGDINRALSDQTRSVKEIVRANLLTPFNILNAFLAALIVIAAIPRPILFINLTFIGVAVANTGIGIIQEIRAKKTIDSLSILTDPHVLVIRDGREARISVHELVLGDLMHLQAGNQISVDARLVSGQGFEVDESLLTGESNHITKSAGADLYSGSVVMAGSGYAVATAVGEHTLASRIAAEAKQETKKPSVIMTSLNRIITILAVVIIPVGIALFAANMSKPGAADVSTTLVSVVAALIGMVPEGLMLLTSVAFAVGVINLGRKKMLVQTLPSIETLARVDTLCLDKTGTITDGQMDVSGFYLVHPLQPGRLLQVGSDEAESFLDQEQAEKVRTDIARLIASQDSGNETQQAIRRYFTDEVTDRADQVVPFSSKRKWSGAFFAKHGALVMGAPEFVLKDRFPLYAESINALASSGYRVVVIAGSDQPFPEEDGALPPGLEAVAAIALVDRLRDNMAETLNYFHEQGVTVKVISGDNPRTVRAVAKAAGVRNADRWIDMSTLPQDQDLSELVENTTLFGRVTPFQKKQLLQALQKNGHVVSMTGDGVNDVLALKEADCSVAMSEGSDAARAAADLVLLNNNISSMVDAVYEGRRVINNIERVATLFLVKTVYSCLLSLLYIFLPFVYPLQPIQISMISGLTIGLPSFVLALKPNKERVRGNFLRNVIFRSVPGGVTAAITIVLSQVLAHAMQLSFMQCSTIAVIVLACVGLIVLHQVSRPMDWMRRLLFVVCTVGLVGAMLVLPHVFFLADIITPILWIYLPFIFLTYWLYSGLQGIGHNLSKSWRKLKQKPFFKGKKRTVQRATTEPGLGNKER